MSGFSLLSEIPLIGFWFLEMMNKTLWILKPQKILINILGLFELSGGGPGYECAANNYHLIISSLTVTYRGSDRGSNQQSNAMDHNYG